MLSQLFGPMQVTISKQDPNRNILYTSSYVYNAIRTVHSLNTTDSANEFHIQIIIIMIIIKRKEVNDRLEIV